MISRKGIIHGEGRRWESSRRGRGPATTKKIDDTAANRPRWLARPGELQQQPIGAHLDGPANALRREQQEEDEKRIPATLRRLCRKFMLQKGETAFGHIPQWRLYLTTVARSAITRRQAR
ncbi:hypothetical protein S40288_09315 [Stachybotrys chartarum IBT 40288]|nr:hypothetical protein S40288_09315 [Stachybotrys chartarum IBT 40288]